MGGSKGSNTTKTSQQLPPEFRAAYTESLGMARDAVGRGYQPYAGQLVAGLNPTQTQGIANVNAAQGVALPAIQQGMGLTALAAQGITPDLYNRFYSPYVRDVADTTFANLMESNAQQRSGLKGSAIQAGAFGGDRSGVAAAEMSRQQNLGLGQTMSGIYNQGYGQAMQLAGQQAQNYGAMGQQLAGLGGAAQGSILQGAQAQLAAGAQQQATEQATLQSLYDQYMQRQSYPYQNAQFFANIAQGLGSTAGGTSSTTTPPPSAISQIMGGVGAIANIASLSDERAKEAIEPVGELFDGQTLYRFRYKGDPSGRTHVGLMAQDVEKKRPGAVTEIDGVKGVDYHDATEEAAAMASDGGAVRQGLGRAGFAEGGIPFAPWGEARGWVPDGKIGSMGGGSSIPDPPRPPSDEALSEDWSTIAPLSDTQQGGLGAIKDNVFGRLGNIQSSRIYNRGGLVRPRFAEGGLSGIEELLDRESGGNFGARNKHGYVGRAQFGDERLEDARRAGVLPEGMDKEAFRLDPDTQQRVEKWHFDDIGDFIDKRGLGGFEGKTVGGVPVTRNGMVNVAHLGGKGGLKKFIETGGRYNPADANGTRLSDYLAMAAGDGAGPGLAPRGATVMPTSAEAAPEAPRGLGGAMGKPGRFFASEDNPSVVESVMGRRLSPEARSALLNASFALMAGRSPFFMTNIGEAGKVGTQTYYNALQKKREYEKQRADISRQGFEAETGRMQVDVAEKNASRQLYAQMLPQIRFWQMRNPGKPLPPEFQRVVDAAFPRNMAGGAANAAAGIPSPVPVEPGVAPAAPGLPATPGLPDPGGEMPSPDGAEGMASPGGDPSALDDLYSQLPEQLNPNYWAGMAESATTMEDYNNASERAAELTKQYQENGIPLPGGTVPFPGTIERKQQEQLSSLRTEGAYKATSDQTERAQRTVEGFQATKNVLDQTAAKLATTTTGQFEDTKAYLTTALNSLGLVNDAGLLAQATGTQELKKLFSQILFSGGLKDKIGSQIAASELEMFSRGFGDVNLEPEVNRFIVGTMRGLLEMEAQRARDWIDFSSQEGNETLSRRDIVNWEIEWNEANPVSQYVEGAIASTPVAGELDFSNPASRSRAKAGYKYVMPNGMVATYNGTDFEVEE